MDILDLNDYYSLEEAQLAERAPWKPEQVIRDDFHVVVYRDAYPVTEGHLLFVPKYVSRRLILDCFDDAYDWGRKMVERGECDGFNVGINFGKAAGQTVVYPHVHLIPRRHGDTADPTGGVRNVIPGAGNWALVK